MIGNDQMDEVKAKLDNAHKLLRRQVSLVEDAEAVDTEGREEVEEDVNFISGTDSKVLKTRVGTYTPMAMDGGEISTRVRSTKILQQQHRL